MQFAMKKMINQFISSFNTDNFRKSAELIKYIRIGTLNCNGLEFPAVLPFPWTDSVCFNLISKNEKIASDQLVDFILSQVIVKNPDRFRIYFYDSDLSSEYPIFDHLYGVFQANQSNPNLIKLTTERDLGANVEELKNEVLKRKAYLASVGSSGRDWITLANQAASNEMIIIYIKSWPKLFDSRFSSDLMNIAINGPKVGVYIWFMDSIDDDMNLSSYQLKAKKKWRELLSANVTKRIFTEGGKVSFEGFKEYEKYLKVFHEYEGVFSVNYNTEIQTKLAKQLLSSLNEKTNHSAVNNIEVTIGTSNGIPINFGIGHKSGVFHTLFAGGTGQGKSVFMKGLILSICDKYSPKEVSFKIFDFKQAGDYYDFDRLPQIGKIEDKHDSPAEILEAFHAIENFAKARKEKFVEAKKMGFTGGDILSYNKWAQTNELETLPFCFYIVDETAELMSMVSSDYNIKRQLLIVLGSIATLGRSVGLSLFISSQTFSHLNIDGVKPHCGLRMSMKVQERQDSRTVLGPNNVGACEIKNRNGIKHIVINLISGAPEDNVFVQLPFDDHSLIAERLKLIIKKWSLEYPEKLTRPNLIKADRTMGLPKKQVKAEAPETYSQHTLDSIFDDIPTTKQDFERGEQ